MNNKEIPSNESGNSVDEKELMDIFNLIDDDLINRQIDELLAEKGECVNMNNIKEKAFTKLRKGQKRRVYWKGAAAAAVVATLTVSTVYGKDIQRALQSFFGKSTVYQTVVDGEAFYLPEKLALGDNYTLKYASMSEGCLELSIDSREKMSDEWYESLNLSVAEPDGGKSYEVGGYGYVDGALRAYFYEMPPLAKFDISLDGEAYAVSLSKAESLAVDEKLVVGVPEKANASLEKTDGNDAAVLEDMPLVANVAASRTDEGSGVGISIVVGFDDRDLKLSAIGEEKAIIYSRMFENNETGIIGSGNGAVTELLMAYDADNNPYELKEPANAIGRPVTTFETNAAPGTPLTLKIPALEARCERVVDRLTLDIPKNGETEVGKELDFIIQKSVVKTIKRTSETTAEVTFALNTGADKNVKICDISAYSKDVSKGETTITGDTAVLTLTFDKNAETAEIEFSWPHFIIEGDWSIEL